MYYISELYMHAQPIALVGLISCTHCSGGDQSPPSWKHTGQSSWERLGIGSLQQGYYHTRRVLYEDATDEWYAPYDPKEVEREERNCTRLARQSYHLVEVFRERFFTYVLLQSLRQCSNISREVPLARLLHVKVGRR